eukprot:TRINITY_DN10061_c0_g1_i1.p1 TRINITY_DN10061_c0_g1~~TRINITY_DN10061_c0_g1_i1.p1  ORF type:complete len:1063 (-),score=187.22 TRINITY_DN10061_c0_g1_i1:320-3508(-)
MVVSWEVVGGAERGGLRVCLECDLSSATAESRLAVGAVLKELEFQGGRLHYELVSGSGPPSGWVTTTLRGRHLIVKLGEDKENVATHVSPFAHWAQVAAKENGSDAQPLDESANFDDCTPVQLSSVDGNDSSSFLGRDPMKADADEEPTEAWRAYEEKFGEARDGRREGFKKNSFALFSPQRPAKTTPAEALEVALSFKARDKRDKGHKQQSMLWDVDSEGEDIPICSHCLLPVGEFPYHSKSARAKCVHAECMAQLIVEQSRQDEEAWELAGTAAKMESRLAYDIGWRMETVPTNSAIAQRLGCSPVPQGLCCLVYDAAARTVRIAATHEPAAAVNLEYLLLALKVRKDAGREPLFSLDPVDVDALETSPQRKIYEPSWLAGTSVGDVMFQADYFMKELALGEYTMPVAGMKSVFDWVEMLRNDTGADWAGREWFVVKNADIRMAEDKTLIPHVRMGVEARELMVIDNKFEDKPVTLQSHPLKRFAENFTRNFDLIAERKSVVFHLRELAKASVMAKFLVDSGVCLDKRWHEVADEIIGSTKPETHPEIPQLWNMRGHSRIKLENGRLVNLANGVYIRAIYGGVQFGLDKFELAQRSGLQDAQMSQGKFGLSQRPGLPGAQMSQRLPGLGMGAGSKPLFMPQRFTIGQRAVETPQGVDLNLDKFSLLSPDGFAGTLPPCSAPFDSREGRVVLGRCFLERLAQNSHNLKEEDKGLLKMLFNPTMCDRTLEGDAFIPPDPNSEYIERVRNLVNEEALLLKRRKAHFSDKGFIVDNAGPEFPSSWTSRFQVDKDGCSKMAFAADKHCLVQVQADAAFQKTLLHAVLPAASPEFLRDTEDGTLFRIYSIGSLEVRTTQEPAGEETVVAVFSRRMPSWKLSSGWRAKETDESETIVKVNAYVEAAESDGNTAYVSGESKPVCHFYVVLETDASHFIVTEKLSDGSITWAVDPDNLNDRNSLAKLLFTVDGKYGMTVRDIRNVQSKSAGPVPTDRVSSASKAYARAIFQLISGRGFRGKWGGEIGKQTNIQTPGFSIKERGSDLLQGVLNAQKTSAQKHEMCGRLGL